MFLVLPFLRAVLSSSSISDFHCSLRQQTKASGHQQWWRLGVCWGAWGREIKRFFIVGTAKHFFVWHAQLWRLHPCAVSAAKVKDGENSFLRQKRTKRLKVYTLKANKKRRIETFGVVKGERFYFMTNVHGRNINHENSFFFLSLPRILSTTPSATDESQDDAWWPQVKPEMSHRPFFLLARLCGTNLGHSIVLWRFFYDEIMIICDHHFFSTSHENRKGHFSYKWPTYFRSWDDNDINSIKLGS